MKTSSTSATTFSVAMIGAILTLVSFSMLLRDIGRDFEWANANVGLYVFFIVIGMTLFIISPMVGNNVGNTVDDLERESLSPEDRESDEGFGGGIDDGD